MRAAEYLTYKAAEYSCGRLVVHDQTCSLASAALLQNNRLRAVVIVGDSALYSSIVMESEIGSVVVVIINGLYSSKTSTSSTLLL